MQQKTILYKDKKISYQIEGEGETIVFLHGFLECKAIWNYHSKRLSENYQVICIDLPGHGESELVSDTLSMELMAEIVHEIILNEKVKKYTLIGHSMGGYVSLAYLEKYPDYLNAYCLFHSHAAADTPKAKNNRLKTIEFVKDNRLGFIIGFIPALFAEANRDEYAFEIEILQKQAKKITKETIIACLRGMGERKSKIELIKKSNIPALFIIGGEDPRIKIDDIFKQISGAKSISILLIENCGHNGYLEEAENTYYEIKDFLERIKKDEK